MNLSLERRHGECLREGGLAKIDYFKDVSKELNTYKIMTKISILTVSHKNAVFGLEKWHSQLIHAAEL